jgi:D-glycero-alpha-D-manno-heptose-7-phosphate kinase
LIITRSPLRITLAGGGTDLPSYYRRFGGLCISAAIDKYVYITLHENFRPGIILKYSKMEQVAEVSEIQNPIIREALKLVHPFENPDVEICSMSDIPGETGLGSSSAFACSLIKALYARGKIQINSDILGQSACFIEKSNPGKQDQYASAYGGIQCFTFNPDDTVEVSPLKLSPETLANLEENLLLVFTGFSRESSVLLSEQDTRTNQEDETMLDGLHQIKSLGREIQKALEFGNLEAFGVLLNEHWKEKKKRSPKMSNLQIDAWYELGLANGALGGKLVGAGGGGFLLFYCSDKPKCRHAMSQAGLREVRFRFDFEGTKVLAL